MKVIWDGVPFINDSGDEGGQKCGAEELIKKASKV